MHSASQTLFGEGQTEGGVVGERERQKEMENRGDRKIKEDWTRGFNTNKWDSRKKQQEKSSRKSPRNEGCERENARGVSLQNGGAAHQSGTMNTQNPGDRGRPYKLLVGVT